MSAKRGVKRVVAKPSKKVPKADKVKGSRTLKDADPFPLTVGVAEDSHKRSRKNYNPEAEKDKQPIRFYPSADARQYLEDQKSEGIDYSVSVERLIRKEIEKQAIYEGMTELELFGEFAAKVKGYQGFSTVVRSFFKDIEKKKLKIFG